MCGDAQVSGDAVHPHRRGEHLVQKFSEAGFNGSSPQAWGTLGVVMAFKVL